MPNDYLLDSTAEEALFLFKVMEKYHIPCSVELNTSAAPEPIISLTDKLIQATYFKGGFGKDALELNASDFTLNLMIGSSIFSKMILSNQIMICAVTDGGAFWFNSGTMSSGMLEEAQNYRSDGSPLVKGISPENKLADQGDMYHASLDIVLDLERGEIDTTEAAKRILQAAEIYKDNTGGSRDGKTTSAGYAPL